MGRVRRKLEETVYYDKAEVQQTRYYDSLSVGRDQPAYAQCNRCEYRLMPSLNSRNWRDLSEL
jgi:hypothetical protein